MAFKVIRTNKFEKQLGAMFKRGKSAEKLEKLIDLLIDGLNKKVNHHCLLEPKYCLHKLSGKSKGSWECHIEPNWLLVFSLSEEELRLEGTGSHSDLFK